MAYGWKGLNSKIRWKIDTRLSGVSDSNTYMFRVQDKCRGKVMWGDGTEEFINILSGTLDLSHTYTVAGMYDVTVIGCFKTIGHSYLTTDYKKVLELVCDNYNITTLTRPHYSISNALKVRTYFSNTQRSCADLLNQISPIRSGGVWEIDISHINTRRSNTLSYSFAFSDFSADVSHFDTSNVVNMLSCFYGAIYFNHDISMWDFSKVTNMTNFMSGKSSENYDYQYYDNLLNKLASYETKTNVVLGMGTIKYSSAGAAARATLVSRGWTITDGGQNEF